MKKTRTITTLMILVVVGAFMFAACSSSAATTPYTPQTTEVIQNTNQPATLPAPPALTPPIPPTQTQIPTTPPPQSPTPPSLTAGELMRDFLLGIFTSGRGGPNMSEREAIVGFLRENTPTGGRVETRINIPTWVLCSEYSLHMLTDRQLELRRGALSVSIGHRGWADIPHFPSGARFDTDGTWVVQGNTLQQWILHEQVASFDLPAEHATILRRHASPSRSVQEDFRNIFFLQSGLKLFALCIDTGDHRIVSDQFANQLAQFCNSLWYIDLQHNLIHVSITDWESEVVANSVHAVSTGDFTLYLHSSGETRIAPFFINWDGDRIYHEN